ncbi:MAG: sigma-70 family RNA polymerase sigma factor [Planctomycetota bacterium]
MDRTQAADGDDGTDPTLTLLQRWHGGDRSALDELLRLNLPWIRGRVRQRLGEGLRHGGDTEDFLHEAVVEVLHYSPRFLIGTAAAFRRLLAQIVENTMRDRHDFFRRVRRSRAAEAPLPDDSVLCLDARARTATSASQFAAKREEEAWLRLALELLEPDDRDIIVRREWQAAPFAAIGDELGIEENAARMRFQRALARLARQVARLRSGEI